jgi:hypothetical protein
MCVWISEFSGSILVPPHAALTKSKYLYKGNGDLGSIFLLIKLQKYLSFNIFIDIEQQCIIEIRDDKVSLKSTLINLAMFQSISHRYAYISDRTNQIYCN